MSDELRYAIEVEVNNNDHSIESENQVEMKVHGNDQTSTCIGIEKINLIVKVEALRTFSVQ